MKHRFVSKRYWKDQQTPMGKVDELAKNYNDVTISVWAIRILLPTN